jgi:hypothetical protein
MEQQINCYEVSFNSVVIKEEKTFFVFDCPMVGQITISSLGVPSPELCRIYELPEHLDNRTFMLNSRYEGIMFYDTNIETGSCAPIFLVDDDDVLLIEELQLFIERLGGFEARNLSFTLFNCAKFIKSLSDTNLN